MIGRVASLSANVAVAEPTVTGRVIASRPSFALIGSYELFMRQAWYAAESTSVKKAVARHRGLVRDANSTRSRSSVPNQSGGVPTAAVARAVAGSFRRWHGSGRRYIGQVMAHSLLVMPSPTSKVGTSAGVGWSSGLTLAGAFDTDEWAA